MKSLCKHIQESLRLGINDKPELIDNDLINLKKLFLIELDSKSHIMLFDALKVDKILPLTPNDGTEEKQKRYEIAASSNNRGFPGLKSYSTLSGNIIYKPFIDSSNNMKLWIFIDPKNVTREFLDNISDDNPHFGATEMLARDIFDMLNISQEIAELEEELNNPELCDEDTVNNKDIFIDALKDEYTIKNDNIDYIKKVFRIK